jgi:hypothetical protein
MLIFLPMFSAGQIIGTIAGNGVRGFSVDSIQATLAQLDQPSALAIDDSGTLYIIDNGNDNICKIAANGIITVIAGEHHTDGSPRLRDLPPCYAVDGVALNTLVWKPQGIAVDHAGNIYLTEGCSDIRKISSSGYITTIANRRQQIGDNIDSDLAVNAILYHPHGIAIDKNDNIFYADGRINEVRRISKNGIISTIAGNGFKGYEGDGGKATNARLNQPWGVAIDDNGNIYISDRGNECIRKVNELGIITTIAGTGKKGYGGDGSSAFNATFNEPMGLSVDHYGNIYIADSRNDAIRKIDTNNIISTFAGNGKRLRHEDFGFVSSPEYSHDMNNASGEELATNTQLYWPTDVVVDNSGNVYIADKQNHVVRKVIVPPVDQKNESEFSVSVDVNKNLLIVTIKKKAYSSFTITDKENKIRIQQAFINERTEVDISELQSGRYFLNLIQNVKNKTIIFVIDK